jgi:hypothetical protein
MESSNKKNAKKLLRYIAAGILTFGLVHGTNIVKAQGPPPPPPSPPPPGQVLKKAGDGLRKINPFKKGRKPVRRRTNAGLRAPGTPPPPPAPGSPLNLKRPPAPPKPPGL